MPDDAQNGRLAARSTDEAVGKAEEIAESYCGCVDRTVGKRDKTTDVQSGIFLP